MEPLVKFYSFFQNIWHFYKVMIVLPKLLWSMSKHYSTKVVTSTIRIKGYEYCTESLKEIYEIWLLKKKKRYITIYIYILNWHKTLAYCILGTNCVISSGPYWCLVGQLKNLSLLLCCFASIIQVRCTEKYTLKYI